MSNPYREQVADLILKDSDGENLVIVSSLAQAGENTVWFLTSEDKPNGAKYKVTVTIEEVYPGHQPYGGTA